MIPLRDTVPARSRPFVTQGFIVVNVLVFLVQMTQGPHLERFIYHYGLVPARYFVPQLADYFTLGEQVFALFSFMFLHGGFWHLLGNMWSLYIFGDNVEDHLGPLRYMAFYLLCGLASGLAHMLLHRTSGVPTIGASGAIAGVMGAYFILFPGSRILTLIPILFIPYFIEIPAYFFLGMWFLMQFLSAAGTGEASGGVAWWAHIGGFVFGMLLLKVFDALPGTGMSDPLRRAATRTTTDRLQLLRPHTQEASANLYATVAVSPFEALAGAHKLVSVPRGFQKRLLRVHVPPGVREGTLLRLKGLGSLLPDGSRGDLLLRIAIQT
ncbi:MAG: rhomboid family intramembrane serine protease [Hyphomicrobiales bacterium]